MGVGAPANDTDADADATTAAAAQPLLRLLDVPGHGKLRHMVWEAVREETGLRGVIFVVDSAAGTTESSTAEAAALLRGVLRAVRARRRAVPVLLAATKQDLFSAVPAGLVGRGLERAVERGGGIAGVGEEEEEEEEEERGGFARMGVEVEVLGGFVGEHGEGLREWWEWMGGVLRS